jgi:hypothetical protein
VWKSRNLKFGGHSSLCCSRSHIWPSIAQWGLLWTESHGLRDDQHKNGMSTDIPSSLSWTAIHYHHPASWIAVCFRVFFFQCCLLYILSKVEHCLKRFISSTATRLCSSSHVLHQPSEDDASDRPNPNPPPFPSPNLYFAASFKYYISKKIWKFLKTEANPKPESGFWNT